MKGCHHIDEPVTESVLSRALQRGDVKRRRGLQATTVRYLDDLKSLLIGFADATAVVLPVRNYPELEQLPASDLEQFQIILGGCALGLASRDLHLSIAGMVSASQPLMEMATTLVAARNGARVSDAKSNASRQNGAKGGRPRKNTGQPQDGKA